MRKFLFFAFLSLSILFFFQPAYAVSNFLADYDVTYTIYEGQKSNVKINTTLTNTSDIYYASSYKIQLDFEEIKNIKAYDSSGPIIPTILENGSDKTINLKFNDRVAGLGKKLTFSLSFDTSNIAYKSGKIWKINIPKFARQTEFNSFNVHVVTPESFGDPSLVKPIPDGKPHKKRGNLFNFTQNDLGESGVSMIFGSEQIYKFNLKYNLSNINIYPIKAEIALPPTTNYQDVIIDSINPLPENVKMDKDNNWLAQFTLLPYQKIIVAVQGKLRMRLNPKEEILSPEQASKYLDEKKYWEAKNPQIISLAKKLKTPQKIYNYVVNKLNYDYSRITEKKPRLGALKALNNPTSSVCLEFTDLFIAIARAAGIPSREVNGYGFTNDMKKRPLSLGQDILHSWPEYYDKEKKTWIMVDPTWGKTTGGIDYFNAMDLDHIAFVIKGMNSEYPIPAGGYKLENSTNVKDVNVSLSDFFSIKPSTFQIIENFSQNYVSGLPIKGELIIKNIGETISDNNQFVVNANFLSPTYQKIGFEKIPPFGNIKVPIYFNKTSFLTKGADNIKISIGGTSISYKIKFSPFFLNIFFLIGGGIIIAVFFVGITIYFIKTRNISFFKQKR